jgi:hypothetical protein
MSVGGSGETPASTYQDQQMVCTSLKAKRRVFG